MAICTSLARVWIEAQFSPNFVLTKHINLSMTIIAPSVLAADFANLGREIKMINESDALWIHCDIMDGSFVPNISFGFPVIDAIRKISTKVLDVHLMVVEPEKYITHCQAVGANYMTIHVEACTHLDRTLHAIKQAGMRAGLALNPGTSLMTLEETLHLCDLVCLMSVNPGFGGQAFIETVIHKAIRLKSMIRSCGSQTLIEIDGGVSDKNAQQLIAAGADVLVAGNYVFSASNPKQTIADLAKL